MTLTTKQTLVILQVVAWIIFIGVCIDAGGYIFNMIYTLGWGPREATFFYNKVDLAPLYQYDRGHFIIEASYIVVVACMKAAIFYLIIKVFWEKKIRFSDPFNRQVTRFVQGIAYLALATGAVSHFGMKYADWLSSKGVKIPEIRYLGFDGAEVWIFMGVSLLIVAQIFKRGTELQEENDLTI
jgi:hypothetical protein